MPKKAAEPQKKKKAPTRDGISEGAVKRLLRSGAGASFRISEDAIVMAQHQVDKFVHDVAKACAKTMSISGAHGVKTLQSKHIHHVITENYGCMGFKEADFEYIAPAAGVTRGLSVAGVRRDAHFGDHRVSDKALKSLVSLAEQFIRLLGAKAGSYASVCNRKTLLDKDVKAAVKDLKL